MTIRVWLGVLAAVGAGGCGGVRNPVSRTVTDMTFETSRQSGLLFRHSEVLSINGLAPMPDVGVIYHYSNKAWRVWFARGETSRALPPSTALAISRAHSFRLVGTVEGDPPMSRLYDLRDQLAKIQRLTARAVALNLAARRLDEDDPRAILLSEELRGTTALLSDAEDEMRRLSREDGLLIARWTTGGSASASGSLGTAAGASRESEDALEGYMILGGLRVSILFIGDDFKQMLARLAESDRRTLPAASVSSYVLSTRRRVYAADLDLVREVKMNLSLQAAALADPSLETLAVDQVTADVFFQRYASLANFGNIAEIAWEKRPFCFVAGSDLPLEAGFGRDACGEDDLTGWQPVVSHLVHADEAARVVPAYRRELEKGDLPPHGRDSGRAPCRESRCDEFEGLRRQPGHNSRGRAGRGAH